MCPSLLGSIIRHSGGKGEFIPLRWLNILNVRISATFHSSVPSASYLSLDFDYQPGFDAVTEEPTPCAWERQHFRDPFILKCAILGMIFSSTHVRVAAFQEPDDNVDKYCSSLHLTCRQFLRGKPPKPPIHEAPSMAFLVVGFRSSPKIGKRSGCEGVESGPTNPDGICQKSTNDIPSRRQVLMPHRTMMLPSIGGTFGDLTHCKTRMRRPEVG